MKGLIVAYGKKDSQGRNRLEEIRGLMKFGGKEVIKHSLDRMQRAGVEETLIVVEDKFKDAYENALKNTDYKAKIHVYQGSVGNQAYVYICGLGVLISEAPETPILAVSDDNLFDFSLDGLVERFEEVDTSVMAVRRAQHVNDDIADLNFGRCVVNKDGKIIDGNYSFSPSEPVDSDIISLDIYVLHPNMVQNLLHCVRNNLAEREIIEECFGNFYAWEANEGFWADIGKPPLRQRAEKYFNTSP